MQSLNPIKNTLILETKLLPPNIPCELLERPELLARLDHGIQGHKVTFINAPAGFGKTTLACQWLTEVRNRTIHSRVGWLTLDAGNNYWRAFWRYFFEACGRIWPEITFKAPQMLSGEPLEETLAVFLNELAVLPGKGTLVLEDFHRIVTPEIHRTLAFLIDQMPRQLRLVILSRTQPALPLARWLSNGDLCTVPAEDLRFSSKNTQKYLGLNLPVIPAPETVNRLQEQTGGWPVALALAVQGAQNLSPDEADKFLRQIDGDYPPIRDFIINEILKSWPETLKDFLLKTSFLNLLNPALAETITGVSESGLLLEELAAGNLFLARQERSAPWYAYRNFFAGALHFQARHQFGENFLRELAMKAGVWYEQNGLPEEAVEAAFYAQAYDRAADLLETITPPACLHIDIYRVRNWLERLPEKVWQARPALCFCYALVLLFTSSDRAAPTTRLQVETPLQMAEKSWLVQENRPNLGATMAFRSCLVWFQGDYRQNLSIIKKALEWLPEDETYWRGIALCNMVPHELYEGRLNNALFLLREAIRLNVVSNNQYSKRAGLAMLAEVYRYRLELDQAVQVYNQIFEEAVQDLSDRSQTLFNLAQICFDRNDLEGSVRYVEQALVGARETGDNLLQVKGSLLLIRLKNLQGDPAQAEKLVRMLVARSQNWPLLLREVEAYQAQLAISRGELKTARHWSVMLSSLPGEGPRVLLERESLVQARLLIAQENYGAALSLLEKWFVEAQEQGRAASECEIWFLKARAYFGEGSQTQATQALRQALALAQPENYSQVFLEDGAHGTEVLRALLHGITDPVLLAFGRLLLRDRALPEARPALAQPALALTPGRQMAVIEPLTRQEQRVLRLLSEGLSNSEIAGELVVSVNTIKSQVKSIYRKLDVNSRREARRFVAQTISA